MRAYILISLLAPGSVLGQVTPAPRSGDPTQYLVTKTTDTADGTCDADCSLREAILAANVHPGFDTVLVPAAASPYAITLAGSDEDQAATGDLDITENLTIRGAGSAATVVEGDGIDRVFHMPLFSDADEVHISGLTIRNGGDISGASAVSQSTALSTLSLVAVVLADNDGVAITVNSSRTFSCIRCTGTGNGTSIFANQGNATISNSTFSGHSGPALELNNAGTLDLENVTVVGTVEINDVASSWRNVLLAGSCQLFFGGSIDSGGGNIESAGDSCGLDPTLDAFDVDPALLGLGPLADNGGNTPTIAIPWNSFAAGFGLGPCPPTDQRTMARPSNGCATGAFEPPIFANGFESGDTTAWSSTVP